MVDLPKSVQIFDEVRHKLALDYIADPLLTLGQIAVKSSIETLRPSRAFE
jgi:hypothetical protein